MKDLKDHLRHAKKVGECIQVSDWSRYLHILYPLHIILADILISLYYCENFMGYTANIMNNRATVKSIYAKHS